MGQTLHSASTACSRFVLPQDRETKLQYLRTVFHAVQTATGKSVLAAPAKVLDYTLLVFKLPLQQVIYQTLWRSS